MPSETFPGQRGERIMANLTGLSDGTCRRLRAGLKVGRIGCAVARHILLNG